MNIDLDNEKMVIGGLLHDRGQLERVATRLGPGDFIKPEHQIAFAELLAYNEDTPVVDNENFGDVQKFVHFLADKGSLQSVGNYDYLVECMQSVTGGAAAVNYAGFVRDAADKRLYVGVLEHHLKSFRNGAGLAEAKAKLEADLERLRGEVETKERCPLLFTPLSKVEAKQIQWFWPNRIPAGMFSMIVGNPGIGKSFVTMDIAAKITTGDKWPDALNTIEPGSVLLFSDEESLEYAIKPRLDSCGADCSKIYAFNSLKLKGQAGNFTLQDSLRHLEIYLDGIPDCRLIVFDPITAYLGDVNANDNAEVRGVLLGLQQLAQRRGITVLGVSHFSKKSDIDAIHRTLGSTAFTAAARSVWAVVTEKTEPDETRPPRLFMPVKSNYSIDVEGLRFNIIDGRVVYDTSGTVSASVDHIIHGGRIAAETERIQEWLIERLGSDTVLADEVLKDGELQGFKQTTVQKAAVKLGVQKRRSPLHSNRSVWSLQV